MNYTQKVIVNILFTALAYVLAPILPLFASASGWLPKWLSWFQTQDASLDQGWVDGIFSPPAAYSTTDIRWKASRYWRRVLWLWRNPAYGFCYWPLGMAYVKDEWQVLFDAVDENGNRIFNAIHKNGEDYSSLDESKGQKFGYKLWWAMPSGQPLPDSMPITTGPDNRVPFCFTP